MRNLFILSAVFGLAAAAYGTGFDVNRSSFTATADTAKQLPGSEKGSTLSAVIVSTPSAGASLNIFDSQGASSSQIAAISLATVQQPHFEVRVSSGITYTTTGTNNGVTLIWR